MRNRLTSSVSESAPPPRVPRLPSSHSPRSRVEPSNPASPNRGSTEQVSATKVKHADHQKANCDSKLDRSMFEASFDDQSQNASSSQRSPEDPSVPASPTHGSTEEKCDTKETPADRLFAKKASPKVQNSENAIDLTNCPDSPNEASEMNSSETIISTDKK